MSCISTGESMNLKDAEKKWQKDCPDEVGGLVSKRKYPKGWRRIINSSKARKQLKEKS